MQESSETIPVKRLRICKRGVDALTPTTDQIVPGYAFDDVSDSGVFQHHLGFALIGGASGLSGDVREAAIEWARLNVPAPTSRLPANVPVLGRRRRRC